MLNFKNLRLSKKMSQKEFADKIGVSTRALSNYENGNLDITLKKMQEIACVLEVGLYDLLTIEPSTDFKVQEPKENYEVNNIIEAQQKTIKILENQLNFANSLIEKSLKSQEY